MTLREIPRSLRPALLAVAIGLVGLAPSYANMVIVPAFDSSITGNVNAVAIENTINSVIAVYGATFADNITVNLLFKSVGTGLGQSFTSAGSVSYTGFHGALVADAKSADDNTAIGTLPAGPNNPVTGATQIIGTTANLRALGFAANPTGATGTTCGVSGTLNCDSTISINTSLTTIAGGSYDYFAVVSHEIDEALGFGSALNNLANGAPNPTGAVLPEDLFRFVCSLNSRSLSTSAGAQACFSINGGATDLAQFNQSASGDFSDWNSNGVPRVQDAFATPGAAPRLGVELTALDVIGYDLVVPEPGTLGLAFGAICLWACKRRQQ